MAKVYALIDCGWDDGCTGDSYSETEHCIGIFTSQELVTKAANDYLAHCLNTVQGLEKEYFIVPETPLTFEQLYGCDDPYEYHNHTDWYGASLYVYEYELDRLDL